MLIMNRRTRTKKYKRNRAIVNGIVYILSVYRSVVLLHFEIKLLSETMPISAPITLGLNKAGTQLKNACFY
jgi:hypothetical protein